MNKTFLGLVLACLLVIPALTSATQSGSLPVGDLDGKYSRVSVSKNSFEYVKRINEHAIGSDDIHYDHKYTLEFDLNITKNASVVIQTKIKEMETDFSPSGGTFASFGEGTDLFPEMDRDSYIGNKSVSINTTISLPQDVNEDLKSYSLLVEHKFFTTEKPDQVAFSQTIYIITPEQSYTLSLSDIVHTPNYLVETGAKDSFISLSLIPPLSSILILSLLLIYKTNRSTN